MIRIQLPVVVLLHGWFGHGMLSKKEEKKQRPKPKERVIRTSVYELKRQDFQTVVRTQGVVRAYNEAGMTAQVAGKVVRISPSLEDGAFFEAGEVLLELDDADFATALAGAEAQLARATAALAQEETRGKQARLNWEDLGYEEEPNELVLRLPQLREAKANVKAAAASLDQAERDLARTQVRAPFAGRVLERTVALGQSVSRGTALATVFQTDFVEVRLPVAARELPFLSLPESRTEAPVSVLLRDALYAESEKEWTAQIIGTEGALDMDSRELFAIARVNDPFNRKGTPEPDAQPLRIGQPVIGGIDGKKLKDVMVIPRAAVRQVNRIYLVDPAELTLERRTIEWVWSDEEHLIVRDETIPDGAWLATSRLVYAPDAARVEIIPAVDEPGGTATPMTSTEPSASGNST
ncbi:MAG: efflux RND transporter periplasmic adaptor subunit [Verrucomicrobiota bacterium]